MSYALTLSAPRRREDAADDATLPAIGVAAAEDAARRLQAMQADLEARFAEMVAKAQKIEEECTAQVAVLIEKAEAEISGIYDAMSAANDEYRALFAIVEEAWGEWNPAPEWFDEAYNESFLDFDSELDDIDTARSDLPSI